MALGTKGGVTVSRDNGSFACTLTPRLANVADLAASTGKNCATAVGNDNLAVAPASAARSAVSLATRNLGGKNRRVTGMTDNNAIRDGTTAVKSLGTTVRGTSTNAATSNFGAGNGCNSTMASHLSGRLGIINSISAAGMTRGGLTSNGINIIASASASNGTALAMGLGGSVALSSMAAKGAELSADNLSVSNNPAVTTNKVGTKNGAVANITGNINSGSTIGVSRLGTIRSSVGTN